MVKNFFTITHCKLILKIVGNYSPWEIRYETGHKVTWGGTENKQDNPDKSLYRAKGQVDASRQGVL